MSRRRGRPVPNTVGGKMFMIIFGLIFLIMPLTMILPIALNQPDESEYEIIDATISKIDKKFDDHYTYISYEYKGKIYDNIRYSVYSSTMYVGEVIEVQVNVNNPSDVKPTGILGSNYFLLIVIIPFAAFGIVAIVVGIKMKPGQARGYGRYENPQNRPGNNKYGSGVNVIKNNKMLKNTGLRMFGTVEKIVNGTAPNGMTFVKVYCTCKDPSNNTIYRYSSEEIFGEIDSAVAEGAPIDVYVNPQNYGDYYVDVPQDYDVSYAHEHNTYSVPYNAPTGSAPYSVPYNAPYNTNAGENTTQTTHKYKSIEEMYNSRGQL